MPELLLHLQELRGNVIEDGKKCLCIIFWPTRRSRVHGEKGGFVGLLFLCALYSTCNINKFLPDTL